MDWWSYERRKSERSRCPEGKKAMSNFDSDLGLRYNPLRKTWIWEERLDYDPDDPRNIAIEAKIAADDRAFLKACGIVAELGRP
jgi:hypothetical protein